MIFGNWRPVGLFMGSPLFGYTQALPFREGTVSVHALLLLVAVLLVARRRCSSCAAARAGRRSGRSSSAWRSWRWYLLTDIVPREFTTMAPYVTTLLVLAFASQRLRMPAADGQIYRKGSAG